MSKIGHIRTSITEERKHRNKVLEKRDKIEGLGALIEMWEMSDPEYAKELRKRRNIAANNLKAMRQGDIYE